VTATVPTQASTPRGRNLLLILVALVVSAVAASATAVALTSRSDLSSARRRVDAAWADLRPALSDRYQNLGAAAAVARSRLGADRAVFTEIDAEVAGWPGTAPLPTERQVAAAARLEGLAGRLSSTIAATPRLQTAADVTAAIERLRQADTSDARTAYNRAVASYQRARGGFPRRLVAGALGYDDRRSFEVSVA
jgi:hypothetical protein